MNFEKHFTKENLQKIIDQKELSNVDNSNNGYMETIESNFYIPFRNLLVALRDENKLSPIENSEGHSTIFSHHWNRFLEGGDEINERAYSFMFPVLTKVIFKATKADEVYDELVKKINEGNFNYYDFYHDTNQCHVCSQRMMLNMENWTLKFSVYDVKPDNSIDYSKLVKPENCLPNINHQVDVSFPSGELLVTDWIRIKAFTNFTEVPEDKRYTDFSLNHDLGRINTTKYYAEKFNFISVSLSNIMTNVYLDNGNLVVGAGSYDDNIGDYSEPPFEEVASVCTDFWGATIIDKEQLMKILIEAVGDAEKATELYEDFLENEFSGDIIQIEPGDYTLSFNSNFDNFKKLDEHYAGKMDAYFTVTKKMKPTNKVKPI